MINPNVLSLEKVRNPRDIGGYVGYQGRKVKMHRLIRSGKISNITSKDEKFFSRGENPLKGALRSSTRSQII